MNAVKLSLPQVMVLVAAALGLGASSCRTYEPHAELAEARQAVLDARYVPTLEYCPQILKEAENRLNAAQAAFDAKDYVTALAEAQKAHRLAEDVKLCREDLPDPTLKRH